MEDTSFPAKISSGCAAFMQEIEFIGGFIYQAADVRYCSSLLSLFQIVSFVLTFLDT